MQNNSNASNKQTMKVGEDPDPAPFLFVNEEIKAKIAAKVYDPKRSAYVPHPEEKYVEVMLRAHHSPLSILLLSDYRA